MERQLQNLDNAMTPEQACKEFAEWSQKQKEPLWDPVEENRFKRRNNCFVGGTLIAITNNKQIPIEQLNINDEILCVPPQVLNSLCVCVYAFIFRNCDFGQLKIANEKSQLFHFVLFGCVFLYVFFFLLFAFFFG